MDVNVSENKDIKIIEMAGKLDSTSAPEVQQQILVHIVPDCRIILEMSKCSYVSSAGLRTLLIIAKALKKENGNGAMVAVPDEIKDVMEMTGFDDMFDMYKTLTEAMNSFKKE